MQITLKAKNKSWDFAAESGETLLKAGLRAGLHIPYECATGTCSTCRVRLIEGDLEDLWPEAPGRRGGNNERLLCQCRPKSDCVLEADKFIYSKDQVSTTPMSVMGRITAVDLLTTDVMELAVEPEIPFRYEAGQFVTLEHGVICGPRAYSMTNFPPLRNRLEFIIKRKHGGKLTDWLFRNHETLIQTNLCVTGPFGRAVFAPDMERNLLCIAGGSGVAGMCSILERAIGNGYFSQYRGALFFGVRVLQDAFWLKELNDFAKELENLSITIAVSNGELDQAFVETFPALKFECGLVHEVASAEMSGRYANVRAYLAGPPACVEASKRMLLTEAKLRPDDIRYDKFS